MKADYNDQEMLIPDHNYVRAMEYGLPQQVVGDVASIDLQC